MDAGLAGKGLTVSRKYTPRWGEERRQMMRAGNDGSVSEAFFFQWGIISKG